MPEAFERCRRNGGKIRTETLTGGRYQPVCYLHGKAYPGHVHQKKGNAGRALMRK